MDIIKDFVIKNLIKWIQYYNGVFKIVVRVGGGGKLPPTSGGEIFYQVVRTWGGVILTI